MKEWFCPNCHADRITEDNVITSICRCGEYFKLISNPIQIDRFPKKDCRLITREKRFEVLKRQKWRCNNCGTSLKYNTNSKWEGKIAHMDHIFPYSKRIEYPNGKENINELSNLQALCPDCNFKKGGKEIQ
jgi:5-methylcytosine-specific restriction endonuclease McrA